MYICKHDYILLKTIYDAFVTVLTDIIVESIRRYMQKNEKLVSRINLIQPMQLLVEAII